MKCETFKFHEIMKAPSHLLLSCKAMSVVHARYCVSSQTCTVSDLSTSVHDQVMSMHACLHDQATLTHVYLISPLPACIHLYLVPKMVSGVVLSLTTAANGEAAIAVTWDAPVDDVAIDHYEIMYVVTQHPAAGGTDNSTTETLAITGVVKG